LIARGIREIKMMKYAVVAVGLSLFPVQASAFMEKGQCKFLANAIDTQLLHYRAERQNLLSDNEKKVKTAEKWMPFHLDKGAKLSQMYIAGCKN
jgi:hypothetical protein